MNMYLFEREVSRRSSRLWLRICMWCVSQAEMPGKHGTHTVPYLTLPTEYGVGREVSESYAASGRHRATAWERAAPFLLRINADELPCPERETILCF